MDGSGLQMLPEDERQLLISICKKHHINPHFFYELLKTEEEYNLKAAAKRRGVRPELLNKIDSCLKDV